MPICCHRGSKIACAISISYYFSVPTDDHLVRLTVPSAEKVLGSSRTLGSACKESCTYTTDWFCRPEFLEK